MKSDKVGTTLKHSETINGNVKNLSKRMKIKNKGKHVLVVFPSFDIEMWLIRKGAKCRAT